MAITRSEFESRILTAVEAVQTALEAITGSGSAVHDETYLFQAVDLGAGNVVEVIQGPAGKTGRVKSVSLFNVSEIFNSVTTSARVDVGTAGDADGYAAGADLSDLAVAAAESPAFTVGALGNSIVGATEVHLSFIGPTGGTPTGIADIQVSITWGS